ncbi:MAG: DUF3833 domain-containing protein [Pseudomonadota bacterium]
MKRLSLILVALLGLSACTKPAIDGDLYRDNTPEFRLERFFDGEIKAWGIVQDRSGNLVQQFEADIIGSVEDGVVTLDETFTYSLGEGVEERIWTITKDGETSYSGSAGDIPSASGTAYGNAMFWGYEMDLPVGDDTYRVTFEDWIWAVDDRRIFNRSYIKKFGIVFAEVTIFMEKMGPS